MNAVRLLCCAGPKYYSYGLVRTVRFRNPIYRPRNVLPVSTTQRITIKFFAFYDKYRHKRSGRMWNRMANMVINTADRPRQRMRFCIWRRVALQMGTENTRYTYWNWVPVRTYHGPQKRKTGIEQCHVRTSDEERLRNRMQRRIHHHPPVSTPPAQAILLIVDKAQLDVLHYCCFCLAASNGTAHRVKMEWMQNTTYKNIARMNRAEASGGRGRAKFMSERILKSLVHTQQPGHYITQLRVEYDTGLDRPGRGEGSYLESNAISMCRNGKKGTQSADAALKLL